MSLDGTYTSLKDSIADWIARDDLTSVIPDFVVQFEAEANLRLRVRDQETVTTLTTTLGVVALPSDYLAWRRVYNTTNGTRRELEYVHPSYLTALYPTSAAGDPKSFTIDAGNLIILPYNDTASAITFDYYKVVPPLASNASNWLLTKWPNVYLNGSLAEAYKYIKNYDSALRHTQLRDDLIDKIIQLDAQSRGPAAIRVMGHTP